MLPRGAGTSLAGQSCNVAVILDFSKYMHHLVDLDPDRRVARVQPGLILDHLRSAAEQHYLTFGPDPATHNRCTLGGMIGNNSCGVHSVMAGRTADNVEELDILTYDGVRMRVGRTAPDGIDSIVRGGGRHGDIFARLRGLRDRYADGIREQFPKIPRRVSGYNLPFLLPEHGFHLARALVGTEGTCVTVLEATVRLVQSPPKRCLVVIGYEDVYQAGDDIPRILDHQPVGLEGLDDGLVTYMARKGLRQEEVALLPPGGGWLLVEFGGESQEEATEHGRRLAESLTTRKTTANVVLYDDPHDQHRLWKVRESGLAGTAHVPHEPEAWTGWEDSAVPPEGLGDYLRAFRRLLQRYGYTAALYGHFGDGCLHVRIPFDLRTDDGIRKYRSFIDEASDLVVTFGGSFSGEHGDGQSRAEFLPKMFGADIMNAFREYKSIWDPDWKMNPGKVIDPYRIDEHLRLGTDYSHPVPETHFKFVADDFSFPQATLRCVGVGECLRTEGGTMCPSYMVTREEKHSTRGRAHLLFEMLQGDPLDQGVARGCGAGSPGFVPCVQRVPRRLPGEGRRGDLQSRILVPLLCGASAAQDRLFDGPHPLVGQTGVSHAPRRESPHPDSGALAPGEAWWGNFLAP